MIVDDLFENTAGPEKCWPGYRKVGTKPGTGRNKGKRVNDCEKIRESASEFSIGDPVIITGDVEFQGKTGDVREIGQDGAFVVVNLYNYGPRSFHTSDVSRNDYADAEDAEDVAEGSLEEIDRRGFLRGMGAAALGSAGVSAAQAGDTSDSAADKMVATLVIAGETRVLDLTPKNFKDVKEATKWLEKFLDDRGIDNWSGKIERGVQGSGNYQRAQISNTSANLGMFGRNEGIEEGDQDFVWLEGDFNGDVKVNSTSQGSWRDRETRQVELIRGKMSNVRPVAGPPPDTGNVVKQAKIPLIIDAGHQKFNATGVDLQLNVDPNSYVIQGNYGLVAGTAVVKIMRPGVAEATGDEKFDKMLKGVTSKKAVTKQQKTDTKQQARDAFGGMFGGGNPADKLGIRPKGVAEGSTGLSIQQLATISDEALDKAYGYGRSTPGNTFGWQANMMSASYAKKMIDSGITDIEAISDAIHKGWNVTAQKFVANPDQFSDTEKLRAAGKLDAKLQQRAQLMKQNYAQLPEEEKEKDRVVARALLKALGGSQGVAEGSDSEELADEVYAEFERTYPNLARRADERTIHAAIIDVLNYGGDSNPSALAQDVARAVKRDMQGVAESNTDRIADRYDPEEFDQMVLRLKTLAGAGPLKTVWDPQKRVYKNVPINPPQDQK